MAPVDESKRSLAAVILAAGLGTRMKSKTAKVLHEVCGRPMITWVSAALQEVSPERTLVVLAPDAADEVHSLLPQRVELVLQEQQLGTGDAVRAAGRALEGFDGDILVLYGDTPLVTGDALASLIRAHREHEPACTLLTVEVGDPSHYGRVCRDSDGRVTRVVEDRDAGAEEKKICEINGGVYAFEAASLWEALALVDSENAQGEIYLTDVIGILASRGMAVLAHKVDDPAMVLGVNSRKELAAAGGIMRSRILERHMLAGVTITDPSCTYVEAGVTIGRDTVLEPMTVLAGETAVGEDCVIGPSSLIADSVIDDGSSVVASHVIGAEVGSGVSVGPFAYLRPGTRLAAGSKAGTFVEIKNSDVGEGAKVPHLSYIGDSEVGAGTNIGAGNITANYDGVGKFRTVIGSDVHTGADTVFVAPVEVGDGAMTGAGSVITGDVPSGGLGIARARQKNIEGYASKKFGPRREEEKEK